MNVFYARVSTNEQNDARQIERATEEGYDKIFLDRASGKNAEREELKKMMDYIREGDTVTVLSIDRLGRNHVDILNIVTEIKNKGAMFKCLNPAFDTSTPFGDFFLGILSSIAELERKQILERQREGIEIAKRNGKYKGRKAKQLDNFEGIYNQWADNKISMEQAGKLLNVSRSTFYRRAKQYEKTINSNNAIT